MAFINCAPCVSCLSPIMLTIAAAFYAIPFDQTWGICTLLWSYQNSTKSLVYTVLEQTVMEITNNWNLYFTDKGLMHRNPVSSHNQKETCRMDLDFQNPLLQCNHWSIIILIIPVKPCHLCNYLDKKYSSFFSLSICSHKFSDVTLELLLMITLFVDLFI